MSLPYFPMYPTDFEAKTSHLTLEEDGAYNRLLRLMWMTPGCSLPDDDAWIMRRMRCDAETYARVVLVVIEEFCTRKAGRITNSRLAKEWQKTDLAHRKRVEAGSMGGKAKALNANKNETSKAKAMPYQPEPEPDIEEEANASSCLSPPKDQGFAEFWEKWPHKDGKQAALKAWRKLSIDEKRLAYRAVTGGWFDRWRTRYKDANPILPASFLNQKRWEDAQQPDLIPINGGTNDQRTDKQSERLNAFIAGARGTP